jgi:hypothetical protein
VSVQRAACSYQLNEQMQKDKQMGKVEHFGLCMLNLCFFAEG